MIRSFIRLAGPASLAMPAMLFAFSAGPPAERAGVPGEGGDPGNCAACHRTGVTANPDSLGKLTILARDYRPGVKQLIRVILEHPEAIRWGFEITPRLASNSATQAGAFTATAAIRVVTAGDRQFATQNATSTFTGQRNRTVWDIEWTPPATAMGDITFFAAGNAANGNGNNQGDFIYTSNATIRPASCNLTTRPTISSVRNGASFAAGAVAMNSLVSIFGTGLQPAGQNSAVEAIDLVGGVFPTSFSCIAVEINNRRAPITFANPTQINAQVPTMGDLGPVQVRVIANPGGTNELRSDPATLDLAPTGPAFFLLAPTPCIAAVLQDGTVSADPSLFPGTNFRGVRPGEIVSLFATGLGPTDPTWQAGEITEGLARAVGPITIEWNRTDQPADTVAYAGLAPGLISGAYQINVRVPISARPNSHNTVRIRVGNALSPDGTTLFVAP